MAVLSANANRQRGADKDLQLFPVAGSVRIYKGALVGINALGRARPFVSPDLFAGIAFEEIDNSSGATDDLDVTVYTDGDYALTLTGAATTDTGSDVFATDDDTIALTGLASTRVGKIIKLEAANLVLVRMRPLFDG